MIAVFLAASLVGWSYWMMFRSERAPGAPKPTAIPARPCARRTKALGVEDDPDLWRGNRGAWTALDDYQLTRLLTSSAPTNRLATNPPDVAAPHAEHEDTA